MMANNLCVRKLTDNAYLPTRGTQQSAGYDLYAAYACSVPAHGKLLVKTDIAISVPIGTYGRVSPRSSLALNHHIDVGAGVIDADYRGPVGVVLFNHGATPFDIKRGDRIAQLIIEKIMTPNVLEVNDLDDTDRGSGGFGSTGQ